MAELGTAVPTGGDVPAPIQSAPPPRSVGAEIGWGLASTAALVAWLTWQWGWVWAVAGVFGILVHETGHLLVINALGCGPSRIHIIPFLGGAATMKRAPRTEFHGVLIAIAGPISGLVAAIPFLAASAITHDPRWAGGAFFIAIINLLNLLPAPPLDGSKALGPALAWIHPMVEKAALLLVGGGAALWAFNRGSILFGAFVAIATLGSLRRGVMRPDARRLSPPEWLGAVALWVTALALCAAVLMISMNFGVTVAPLRLLGIPLMARVVSQRFDGILIIGAGLAGLSAALACAPRRALVLSAAPLLSGCSSAWAQGGMAAAMSEGDDPAQHAADTIAAGAGLVDPAMAALLTREGPDAVRGLAALGAPFDRTPDGGFAQSLEAAHGRARVARVRGDQAGREIMRAVAAAAMAATHIEIRPETRVRALLQDASGRVRGVLVEHDGRLGEIIAPATILATGGLGGLYAVTTNPRVVRGEGLALAALAGAKIADPEFVQFHPTAIAVDADPAPLASEALRGEGAVLIDAAGAPFMAEHHPMGDLAPRDVVARAIHAQLAAGRGAFLDARAAVGEAFPEEFPAVFAACMAAGIDPRVQPIPVAPAAHYHMGGIAADADGRTSLPGLFAAGECASTGVHGANRLASNSLLEAAVFGARAGRAAAAEVDPRTEPLAAAPSPDLPDEALQTLRRAMSRHAGVARDARGLRRLIALIDGLEENHGAAPPLVAARLVAASALAREESRGGHYRRDFPALAAAPHRTLIDLDDLGARPARLAAE